MNEKIPSCIQIVIKKISMLEVSRHCGGDTNKTCMGGLGVRGDGCR